MNLTLEFGVDSAGVKPNIYPRTQPGYVGRIFPKKHKISTISKGNTKMDIRNQVWRYLGRYIGLGK